jgi:phage-related protein
VSNTFTFNGQNSGDFGMWISGSGTYNMPERDVTIFEVPGRNGNLVVDNGRYKNVQVVYPASIPFGFAEKAQALRTWLGAQLNYERLTDDYDTTHYRLGRFVGGLDFSTTALNEGAEFSVAFDCKPQRFLTSGEESQAYYSSVFSVYNPTPFPAKPLIVVRGSGAGTLTFNGSTINISQIDDLITIDFETQTAYKGTTNLNSRITLAEGFPDLEPGANSGSFGGGVTRVDIIPRWWEL